MAKAKKINTGEWAEGEFVRILEGRKSFVYKFTDAKAAKNKNVAAVPADFLVAEDNHLYLAEIKSTGLEHSFPFSMVTRMEKMVATIFWKLGIGAFYMFYVYHTERKTWYMFSAAQFCVAKKKSIPWEEMAFWGAGNAA